LRTLCFILRDFRLLSRCTGMQIRHCALSLVGEPIMYPHINELIDLLHSKQISSFLVTNAQFPDEIKSLEPVTQLYVSVDAATKESLKKIDRPLFKDFWERFLACLRALKDKVGPTAECSSTWAFSLSLSLRAGSANRVSLDAGQRIQHRGNRAVR
jgi:wyosine [tRNA(Phe)-imidazoG37] synthetase (radical SAM superfamily)